ncbi:MAG: hypothetical protein ABEJ24_00290 [Candidatus Magasanikbacteria bacterium]
MSNDNKKRFLETLTVKSKRIYTEKIFTKKGIDPSMMPVPEVDVKEETHRKLQQYLKQVYFSDSDQPRTVFYDRPSDECNPRGFMPRDPNISFPTTVEVVYIQTEDGSHFTFRSKKVPVMCWDGSVNSWKEKDESSSLLDGFYRYGRLDKIMELADLDKEIIGDLLLRTEILEPYCSATTILDETITFEQARNLSEGDVLARKFEQPFRWFGSKMTNREIEIPPERPHGHEWQKKHQDIRFAQPIKEENWGLFLEAIEGKFLDEINSNELVREQVKKQRKRNRNKERIEKVKGECFDGDIFDKCHDVEVSLGERLLFIGKKDGEPVYVVDSPNYGHAMFVFDKEELARDFANGEFTATKAKELAVERVVHAGDWQNRAEDAVESAPKQES